MSSRRQESKEKGLRGETSARGAREGLGRALDSREEFAALVAREIADLTGSATSYDARALRIENSATTIGLDGPYRAWLDARSEADRERVVAAGANQLGGRLRLRVPDSIIVAAAGLYPRLASLADTEVKILKATSFGAGKRAYEPVTDELVVQIGWAEGNHVVPVTDKLLQVWGVSFKTALDVAMRNVRDANADPFTEVQPGMYGSGKQRGHNAAFLLANPESMRRLRVKGDILVAATSEDMLIVTGADDDDGLLRTAMALQAAFEQDDFVSPVLHGLDGTRWAPRRLPSGHPIAATLNILELRCLASAWFMQGQVMNKRAGCTPALPAFGCPVAAEIRGEAWVPIVIRPESPHFTTVVARELSDIRIEFSAKPRLRDAVEAAYQQTMCLLAQSGRAQPDAFATWIKGECPLSLPQAGLVSFFDPGAGSVEAVVEWDTAVRLFGRMMVATDHRPRRCVVRDYPNEAEIQSLAESSAVATCRRG